MTEVYGYKHRYIYPRLPGMLTDPNEREYYLDDAAGYMSGDNLAVKFNPPVKCDRCERWACSDIGRRNEKYLCLQCRDDWGKSDLLDKHGYQDARQRKRWYAAYAEFCQTKRKDIDIEAHNESVSAHIIARSALINTLQGGKK